MTLATEKQFFYFPEYSRQIAAGGLPWLRGNVATVKQWAAVCGIDECVSAALQADLASKSPAVASRPIAPLPGPFSSKGWTGPHDRKPWSYDVTVAIPVLDSPASAEAIVELMRLQTEKPFIQLIDTGSSPENLAALQKLEAPDVEVHSLRFAGVRHPSDFPAVAMDLAFSSCRTPYILATHADCFLMTRTVVAELVRLCHNVAPVVGYEITERPHTDWRGMVGHTLTMFDVQRMDRINAGWSLRRLVTQFKHPDGRPTRHDIAPATSPNWPDTEILINYQLRQNGITPHIIGTEQNASRTTDNRIDHCRSAASAALYSNGSDYQKKSTGWLEHGIAAAWRRVNRWRSNDERERSTR